jgi:hypothetical protein
MICPDCDQAFTFDLDDQARGLCEGAYIRIGRQEKLGGRPSELERLMYIALASVLGLYVAHNEALVAAEAAEAKIKPVH